MGHHGTGKIVRSGENHFIKKLAIPPITNINQYQPIFRKITYVGYR